MLQRKLGDLGKVVWELGKELTIAHIYAGRVTQLFVEQHQIDQFARVEHIARVGVAVGVGPGDILERELAYGHHSSAGKHESDVWEKAAGDVRTGGAIVLPVILERMVRGVWGLIRWER